MGNQRALSSKYNMSLGFIPVIVSMLLCEFTTQDLSTYLGTGVGFLLCLFKRYNKELSAPHFLLYSITGMLLLLSVIIFFSADSFPPPTFPFTLEISAAILTLIVFLNRKRFLVQKDALSGQCCQQVSNKNMESTIVSARVVLIIIALHLLVITIALLFAQPLGDTTCYVLFKIAPPAVFILSIGFNEFGIRYFNRMMQHTTFLPMVNKKGAVVGKAIASEAILQKNEYIIPVIRVAVASRGMLFLLPRPDCCPMDKGKTDLLMEGYLLYGETLEQGVRRILKQMLPTAPLRNLHFNFRYHFENDTTNRLIYLFTLDLDDDSILCNEAFKGGKLWTLQQIEHNLGCNLFSLCFEHEYEQLKTIICTREKYKEF